MSSAAKTNRTKSPNRAASKLALVPEECSMEIVQPNGLIATVRYMFVDPDAASVMLNANTHNRTPNESTRDGYADDMAEKRWGFTGDPIQFGEDGLLLNGQHRLFAIEKSGVGQWLFVIDGLPNSVQLHMDSGLVRKAHHQYQLADDVENASNKTSVAALLLRWRHWVDQRTDVKPTVPAVIQAARQHRDAIERGLLAAREVHSGRVVQGKERDGGVGGGVSIIALAALHVRAMQVADPDDVELFFHKLILNEKMDGANDPVRRVRNKFNNSRKANLKNDLFVGAMGFNASATGGALGSTQLPAGTRTVVPIIKIPDLVGPYREDLSEARVRALATLENMERNR